MRRYESPEPRISTDTPQFHHLPLRRNQVESSFFPCLTKTIRRTTPTQKARDQDVCVEYDTHVRSATAACPTHSVIYKLLDLIIGNVRIACLNFLDSQAKQPLLYCFFDEAGDCALLQSMLRQVGPEAPIRFFAYFDRPALHVTIIGA